jgi:cytochrome c553
MPRSLRFPRARSFLLASLVMLTACALAVGAPASGEAGDAEAGRRKAEPCAACHGPGGNSVTPGTPSVSAMPVFYTHWQLIMFRDGRRRDPQMTPFVQNLTDEDLGDLSAYYAQQPATGRPAAIDAAKAAAGAPIAQAHHCTSCHGPQLMGQHPNVPRLAGQDFDYLLRRLRGYRTKTTSDLDGMMTMVSQSLTDEDIKNLVHFIAGLKPSGAPAAPGAR